MQVPRRVATVNKHVTNRIQGLWAWLVPPWAVVHHTGRTSGRAYRTPVVGFSTPQGFAIPLLYGPQTQWAKNLLAAGGGEVQQGGRRRALIGPRVVPASEITATGVAGRYTRAAPSVLIGTLRP
ncbi:nitroreductase family deazaflavin-dependent oxidoreductase [uncultured Williamsia sp.]|uniref:nitroreductase family deazaflavin-dependent oxidoreductase n=1 Tax=uncultured Williamsia sp. TaxID=259311 RepID=UPI002607BA47|nr:nitroreductase family deazaflavin-dependent oxidoreductase [uncultured Williamsia sp.]